MLATKLDPEIQGNESFRLFHQMLAARGCGQSKDYLEVIRRIERSAGRGLEKGKEAFPSSSKRDIGNTKE